jgi:DnaJ-domain-containing protein 1
MTILSDLGRRRVYRVLVHVSLADGDLHPAERKVLESSRKKLGLTEAQAKVLEEEALEGQGLQLDAESNEGKVALKLLSQLVVADGVLHPDEARRLNRISEALGVSTQQLARILRSSMIKRNQDSE